MALGADLATPIAAIHDNDRFPMLPRLVFQLAAKFTKTPIRNDSG